MATSFERMKARREKLGIAAPAPRTAEQTAQTQLHNANLAQSLATKGAPTTVQGTTTSVVNPRTQNTLSFQTGTSPAQPVQRPVTPAPVSNTGITAPTAQTDAERALFIKLNKGDTLNDEDYGTLYDIQKKRQQTFIDESKAGSDAIAAKQREAIVAEEARVKAREEELRKTTEGRVQLYKEAQEAQGALEKQRAERTANENLATSERLLGARGNLTSAVGYQNARDLENERVATLNAVDNRVAAQVALYQAQLEEADSDTLNALSDRVNELYAAEQEAILTAETNLQNLKLTAQQQGDTDLMALVAQQQANLTKNKVENSYSKDITEAIGDGYLYGIDASGVPVRLKDAEGNEFKSGGGVGKDRYMNVGGDVFDMSTGTFVSGKGNVPSAGSTSSSGGSSSGFGLFDIQSTGTPQGGVVTEAVTEVVPNTFAEYLAQEEEKAMQTLGPEKRAELQKTYEALKIKPTQKAVSSKPTDLSKYSYEVREVIRGGALAADILTGGSAAERARFRKELDQAEKEGLLQSPVSKIQRDFTTKLNEDVSKNETYKKTTSMRNYKNNVEAALQQGTGVGDLAAINQFQKVIDEGAVTRDQDVKLIQQSQSLVNTLNTYKKKLEKGEQLSPTLRQQMRTAVQALFDAQVKALEKDPYIKAKTKELEKNQIDINDTILSELGSFSSGSTGGQSYNGYTLPY